MVDIVSTSDDRYFQGTSLHHSRSLEQQNTHNVLQLMESFLYHHIGVKVVFKVALVVLKFSLGRQHVLKKCPTMCETLEVLRHPPQAIMDEEFVVYQVTANTRFELICFMCTCMRHVYQCIAVLYASCPSVYCCIVCVMSISVLLYCMRHVYQCIAVLYASCLSVYCCIVCIMSISALLYCMRHVYQYIAVVGFWLPSFS